MEKPSVILASASPRRKELIQRIFQEVIVIPADIDESAFPTEPTAYYAERLARQKAACVSKKHPNEIVIGCDTTVLLDDAILGKPGTPQKAAEMLLTLSGREHQVISGVCIMQGDYVASFSEKTHVKFFKLSEKEIQAYVATNEPLDKAGAYGIQGMGALLVEKIYGDFYNVVGLPVARLSREMENFQNNRKKD